MDRGGSAIQHTPWNRQIFSFRFCVRARGVCHAISERERPASARNLSLATFVRMLQQQETPQQNPGEFSKIESTRIPQESFPIELPEEPFQESFPKVLSQKFTGLFPGACQIIGYVILKSTFSIYLQTNVRKFCNGKQHKHHFFGTWPGGLREAPPIILASCPIEFPKKVC